LRYWDPDGHYVLEGDGSPGVTEYYGVTNSTSSHRNWLIHEAEDKVNELHEQTKGTLLEAKAAQVTTASMYAAMLSLERVVGDSDVLSGLIAEKLVSSASAEVEASGGGCPWGIEQVFCQPARDFGEAAKALYRWGAHGDNPLRPMERHPAGAAGGSAAARYVSAQMDMALEEAAYAGGVGLYVAVNADLMLYDVAMEASGGRSFRHRPGHR
jgi:hypothetical protein